jgi:hypothetical protein
MNILRLFHRLGVKTGLVSQFEGGDMPAPVAAAPNPAGAPTFIFRYSSCPVCGSDHIYKTPEGFERCRMCDPFSAFYIDFVPRSRFVIDDGREALCLPGRGGQGSAT